MREQGLRILSLPFLEQNPSWEELLRCWRKGMPHPDHDPGLLVDGRKLALYRHCHGFDASCD